MDNTSNLLALTGLVLAVLALLAVGLGLLWFARRTQRRTGLPAGAVVYSDTGAERAVHHPLVSHRYGLVGKPDYLVEIGQGKTRMTVPLEVKSRRQPRTPDRGHVLQLATYCLLVEDLYGVRPSHGYLRYADATLTIPFTNDLRQSVLEAAAAIRRARTQADVQRSHQDTARCARCGYSQSCGPQALSGTQATGTQGRQH
jgi:CRISPR-associated exonuclease Cas4